MERIQELYLAYFSGLGRSAITETALTNAGHKLTTSVEPTPTTYYDKIKFESETRGPQPVRHKAPDNNDRPYLKRTKGRS